MKIKKIIIQSLINSLGVLAYVSAVATLMFNGNAIFGKEDKWWMPVLFLMLFVFSALITALLVLGRPIALYLANEKKAAWQMIFTTAAWILIIILSIFIVIFTCLK